MRTADLDQIQADALAALSPEDRDSVTVAQQKSAAGEKLMRGEKAALGRFDKQLGKILRQRVCRMVPKGEYAIAAGRSVKVCNEQISTYGIPATGGVVDLLAVIHWLHSWLSEHKIGLLRMRQNREEFDKADHDLKFWKAEKIRDEVIREREQWMPLSEVRALCEFLQVPFRAASQRLRIFHDQTPVKIINEAVDRSSEELRRWVEAEVAAGRGPLLGRFIEERKNDDQTTT